MIKRKLAPPVSNLRQTKDRWSVNGDKGTNLHTWRVKLRKTLWAFFLLLGFALITVACRGVEEETPQVIIAPQPTASLRSIQLRTFNALWSSVQENYIHISGVEDVWRGAYDFYLGEVTTRGADEFPEIMREMLANLPAAAATWQSRDERIAQDSTVPDVSYEGIGAYIAYRDEPDPHVVLLSIVPNSPASKAGLLAHESVIAIDGVPISREEGIDAVLRIRGLAGSQVVLTVRSPAGGQRDVIVVREKLVASGEVQAGEVSNTNIGYILFPVAPYENMAEDVLDGLQRITGSGTRNVGGLILDLRISRANSGWPLGEMLALFSDGELGEFFTREASEAIVIQGQNVFGSQVIPLVILVGPDTRGLPEVFAAMMQANGRAQIFGLPTAGNIERLDEFPLPDGSRVFIATSSYRTPNGLDVGLFGVNPSVRVDADWDQVTDGFDQVLNQAVNQLRSGGLEGQ